MLYNQDWNVDELGKILLRAADLIEKHGHVKYVLKDNQGRMCFLGAIEAAGGNYHDHMIPLSKRMIESLNIPYRITLFDGCDGHIVDTVINWNNDGERTAQEVIDGMRKTAREYIAQ